MSDWPYPYLGNGYDAWKLSSPQETPCDACPLVGRCKRVPTACWDEAELENEDHE